MGEKSVDSERDLLMAPGGPFSGASVLGGWGGDFVLKTSRVQSPGPGGLGQSRSLVFAAVWPWTSRLTSEVVYLLFRINLTAASLSSLPGLSA